MFGRFVPDFGRVVAQMQFDMYHHYTVDEHSIRAHRPARRDRARRPEAGSPDRRPRSSRQIASRRVLYVAVLLHDIAKGRGGDHSVHRRRDRARSSVRGSASIAAETETVSWLVRHHLLMSSTAFKRDLADPKTIDDFVRQVQSPERLRLLLVLTVVDIRAVGPGVWNDWKRTLLRTLFEAAEERLRLGHKQHGRSRAGSGAQQELGGGARLESERRASAREAPARQLLAGRAAPLAGRQRATGRGGRSAHRRCRAERGRRRRCRKRRDPSERLHAGPRRPVLPHLRGARRRPARTSSMRESTPRATAWRSTICSSSMARDGPIATAGQRGRLVKAVEAALLARPSRRRCRRPKPPRRTSAFEVAPSVAIAERASTRTTVVEVNARDRPALLAASRRRRSTLRPHDPLRAYRHLRRTRGRRLLSDRARRRQARRRARSRRSARSSCEAAREPSRAKAA